VIADGRSPVPAPLLTAWLRKPPGGLWCCRGPARSLAPGLVAARPLAGVAAVVALVRALLYGCLESPAARAPACLRPPGRMNEGGVLVCPIGVTGPFMAWLSAATWPFVVVWRSRARLPVVARLIMVVLRWPAWLVRLGPGSVWLSASTGCSWWCAAARSVALTGLSAVRPSVAWPVAVAPC